MIKSREVYECELNNVLIKLDITPNYRGYEYIVHAIRLIFRKPERLQYVTKELYPVVAQQYCTDWRAVEHSIRIAVSRSWDEDPERFKDLFMGWVKQKPSAGRFLSVLYAYLSFAQEGHQIEEKEKNI